MLRYAFIEFERVAIDRLGYRYDGNQVRAISDASGRSEGFHDAGLQGDAYEYDSNGNMVVDRNKGISVRYNRLNLIDEVSSESGEVVRFGFDSVGLKCFREALGPGANRLGRRDYVGDCIFEDGALRRVAHDEGRIVRDSDQDVWRFQYFLADHLGSVRVGFEIRADESGGGARPAVVYAGDYYATGLRIDREEFDDVSDSRIAPLFTGKELQDVMGLQWYDFGARMLDPAIGRWFVLDPSAETQLSVTPYGYVLGNPVRYVDPDGRDVDRGVVSLEDTIGSAGLFGGAGGLQALAGALKTAVSSGAQLLSTIVGLGSGSSSHIRPVASAAGPPGSPFVGKLSGPKLKYSVNVKGGAFVPSPSVEIVGGKIGVGAQATILGGPSSTGHVTVGAVAVWKVGANLSARGLGFEAGAAVVAKVCADACFPGGFICGTGCLSKGPQIGGKIQFGAMNAIEAKFGYVGAELGVEVKPEVILDTIVNGVDAYQKLTSGQYLPPEMRPPSPSSSPDDW